MWRKVCTPTPPPRTCTPLNETLVNGAASSILLSFLYGVYGTPVLFYTPGWREAVWRKVPTPPLPARAPH